MSITPTGNPAWVRSNGHTAYGGDINKTNFQSIGTINPRTDLSAENICRIAADLAAVARTAPFAVMTYTCNDTVPAAPTIASYFAMAGSAPTATRNGDGDVSFTWANSYADDYGVSGNAHIVAATATGYSPLFLSITTVELLDSNADGIFNRVRVRAFDELGAALLDPKITLCVWTG